jgi:hypothetical protein
MNLTTRFWIQIAGAVFFAVLLIAELAGLKEPVFAPPFGPVILVLAGAVMLFEAWRTRRKINQEEDRPAATEAPDK